MDKLQLTRLGLQQHAENPERDTPYTTNTEKSMFDCAQVHTRWKSMRSDYPKCRKCNVESQVPSVRKPSVQLETVWCPSAQLEHSKCPSSKQSIVIA
jgi:hypothetical protein